MKFVEIYKTQNDGSQNIIAICKFTDAGIVCEGEEPFVKNLEEEGISDYSDSSEKRIFPKDGVKFLENLKFAFKSGYLNASDIKEE